MELVPSMDDVGILSDQAQSNLLAYMRMNTEVKIYSVLAYDRANRIGIGRETQGDSDLICKRIAATLAYMRDGRLVLQLFLTIEDRRRLSKMQDMWGRLEHATFCPRPRWASPEKEPSSWHGRHTLNVLEYSIGVDP